MYAIDQDWRFWLFVIDAERARESAYGARLRALAHSIACIPRVGELAGDKSDLEVRVMQLDRLLSAVQARVRFVREARYRHPLECWDTAAGDCKSSATLLGALVRSLHGECRFAAWGDGEEPDHVCVEIAPSASGPWLWAETTIVGAKLGEPPPQAAARQNVRRNDLRT